MTSNSAAPQNPVPVEVFTPHYLRVRSAYPRAYYQVESVYHSPSGRFLRQTVVVYERPHDPSEAAELYLGEGHTPAQAWQDAWATVNAENSPGLRALEEARA